MFGVVRDGGEPLNLRHGRCREQQVVLSRKLRRGDDIGIICSWGEWRLVREGYHAFRAPGSHGELDMMEHGDPESPKIAPVERMKGVVRKPGRNR